MEHKVWLFDQWGQDIPFRHYIQPSNNVSTRPFDIARLLSEKEVLDNGLANCVTYLHALRKKQARNERRLSANPSLPRKKRKRIQQAKRNLEREIKNREQDEQAFLNNLQACRTNIYMANTISRPKVMLPSVTEHDSSSANCSFAEQPAPSEFILNGWTDDAAVSPFQRQCNNPFFENDIAPDDCIDRTGNNATENRRPRLLTKFHEYNSAMLAVPPNTARTPFPHSILSPNAAVFEPQAVHTGQEDALGRHLQGHNISPPRASKSHKHVGQRRVTDAGIEYLVPKISRLCLEEVHGHTWCTTTPQRSPTEAAAAGERRRSRTRSL